MKSFVVLMIGLFASASFGAGQMGPIDPSKATPPKSLLQAISTAVKHNPKTVAIDELLESIHFSTLATKASRLPRGSLNCSVTNDWTDASYNGRRQRTLMTTSQSCGISASYTLFDGGAGRYRTKAAQASEASAAASYNTADSHIPNTRGGLANETKQIFSSIAEMNAYLEFYREYLLVLYEFKKFSNDNNLLAVIGNIEQSIAQFESNLALNIADFKYVVTVEPAPNLDGFDDAIKSLTIPASADEAVQIAVERGPEVLRRNLNVKMAEFNLKAERAAQGPFISLGAGVSQGQYRLNGDTTSRSSYRSASVGIHLTVPLDPAGRYRVQAAEKYLASQRSEREAALADAEQSIRSTYASLENNHRLYIAFKKNVDDQLAYVQNIASRISRGDTTGLDITHMLADMRILDQRYSNFENIQEQILTSLFSIQQVTGLLFDNIDAQPQIQTVF